MGLSLMLLLIGIKLVATCLTLGSGNSGGIFAPSLFMGAVAGGAFGYLVHFAFPGVTATPGAYALVGMAAMVAGTTHAPMTAMLIIFEMTSDYRIILPLMVAVVFSALVAGRLFPHSIYTIKLFKRGIDLRHGKDINVLRSHTVIEVMDKDFDQIPAWMNLHDIFHHIETSKESYYVVNDRSGNLKGVISLQGIRNLLSHHELDYLVIAQDMVPPETIVVRDTDNLEDAHKVFGHHDFKLLPVVTHDNPHKVVGVIRKEALTDYYNLRLLETLRH
jgi:CIC family chloride channel protein